MIAVSSNETYHKRIGICNSCEYVKKVLNCLDVCSKCSCVIEAKIRLASASCPENKWAAQL